MNKLIGDAMAVIALDTSEVEKERLWHTWRSQAERYLGGPVVRQSDPTKTT